MPFTFRMTILCTDGSSLISTVPIGMLIWTVLGTRQVSFSSMLSPELSPVPRISAFTTCSLIASDKFNSVDGVCVGCCCMGGVGVGVGGIGGCWLIQPSKSTKAINKSRIPIIHSFFIIVTSREYVTSSPHLGSEVHRFLLHTSALTRKLFQPCGQRRRCPQFTSGWFSSTHIRRGNLI